MEILFFSAVIDIYNFKVYLCHLKLVRFWKAYKCGGHDRFGTAVRGHILKKFGKHCLSRRSGHNIIS